MKRRRLLAASCVLLALAACRKDEPKRPLPQHAMIAEDVDLDRDNLLNLAHGASVISRSAELTLENSAVHAIDGDWLTFWKSTPGGPQQTFVFSLPARSRIDRVGVIAPTGPSEVPPRVRFEASDDGATWRDVAALDVKAMRDPQLVSVTPFDATYLRARTEGISAYYSAIRSFVAMGRELAPPVQPRIEGCWTINGVPARFVQRGTSIAGVIGSDPPVYVSGGTDGRVFRLMWRQDQMWGPALITLDPRRRALSGVRWHEVVRDANIADGWFGTPSSQCAEMKVGETEIAATILKRAGKWTAYGGDAFATLAALVAAAPSRQFRVVARDATQAGQVRSTLSSHVEIVTAAAKSSNEPQRVIADGVELHVR